MVTIKRNQKSNVKSGNNGNEKLLCVVFGNVVLNYEGFFRRMR